jgi:hypothetical protein
MSDSQEEARQEQQEQFIERGRADLTTNPPLNEEEITKQGNIAEIDTALVPAVSRHELVIPEHNELEITAQNDIAGVDTAIVPAVSPVTTGEIVPNNVVMQVLRRFWEHVPVWWASFRLWRLRRPFAGAILMLIASLLMAYGPMSLLRFALLPGSTIWAGLLVAGLLFVMALIQLLSPSHALITGAVGVVLSLVSLLVASFGGLVIGAILGIIGSALGVAWQPNARPLPERRSRRKKGIHIG